MRDASGLGYSQPTKGSKNLGILLLAVSLGGLIMVAIMGRAQLIDFVDSLLNPGLNQAPPQTTYVPAQHINQSSDVMGQNGLADTGPISSETDGVSAISSQASANISSFNRTNFSILLADPDKYAGIPVHLSGKVYDLIDLRNSEGDVLTVKLHVDTSQSNDAYRAIIFYQGIRGSAPESSPGSCVLVSGKVRGSMLEASSLGNSITVPAIDSSNLTEIPCVDSAMPAEKSIQLQTTQSLNGIIVQAVQIQYANDHTRLQVTVENNAAGSTIYLKEAYAIQNGTSHSQILSMPKFEIYQIADAIAPGQPAAGYIFFDPLDSRLPTSVKVIIETPGIPESTDSVFIFSTTRP